MTITTELDKLTTSKTLVRKAIQRKRTGLTLAEIYAEYHKYIANMSSVGSSDSTGLLDYAEDRCYSLELNVSRIRPYAFKEYTCLQQLYLNTTEVVELANVNAFYGISPTIFVPSNLLNAYKQADNWKELSDRIQPFTSLHKDNMYLLQHIDRAYTVGWLDSLTLHEIENEFRV